MPARESPRSFIHSVNINRSPSLSMVGTVLNPGVIAMNKRGKILSLVKRERQTNGVGRQKAGKQLNILSSGCGNCFEVDKLDDAIESDGRNGRPKLL